MLLLLALLVGADPVRLPTPASGPPQLVASAAFDVPPQEPTAAELRAALDALRFGAPGQLAFDLALERLPALLRSRSPWFVAGAAYVAGRHTRTECVPALLEALEREDARAAGASDRTKRALLDALVRLEASVPVQLACQRLEPDTLAQVFLLLAREPGSKERSAALLAVFDAAAPGARARWAAACTLVAERVDGISARLVAGMDWTLRVCVSDAGAVGMRSGGGRGRFGSAHAAWPPRVTYRLELPAEDAALVPIRHVQSEYARSGPSVPELDQDAQLALRVRLLEHWIGARDSDLDLRWSRDVRCAWTDAVRYRRDLSDHIELLRARLGRLLGVLALPPELLDAVVIRVEVYDARSERAEPLPAGPALRGVVYER